MSHALDHNLAGAQSVTLKLLARAAGLIDRVPLFYPRMVLHTGRTSLAGIYDEVFCRAAYDCPKPLPPQPTIVDAGAHAGVASMYFLTHYPDSQVTAFEPNPHLAAVLRQNLQTWSDRCTIHEAALSTQPGQATFQVTKDNPFNVTGGLENREMRTRAVSSFTVQCLDARQILPEHIDFMKLDVEGHEYQLLELDLFRPERVSNMVIEFHDLDVDTDRYRRTIDSLTERGYSFASESNHALSTEAVRGLSAGSYVLKLF